MELWKKIFYGDEHIEMLDKCSRNEYRKHYPQVKEDKKGLRLKVDLDDNIDFLRNSSGEKEWIDAYDEFKKQLEENPDKEIWCE